jgi:hypothetical protein
VEEYKKENTTSPPAHTTSPATKCSHVVVGTRIQGNEMREKITQVQRALEDFGREVLLVLDAERDVVREASQDVSLAFVLLICSFLLLVLFSFPFYTFLVLYLVIKDTPMVEVLKRCGHRSKQATAAIGPKIKASSSSYLVIVIFH